MSNYYHHMSSQKITKYLKLPFLFEEHKLLAELKQVSDSKWKAHHYRVNYNGDWTSIALYAQGGDEDNIVAQSTVKSDFKETLLLGKCKYLKEVISRFKCPLLSVRLLRLGPGAEIKPHKDYKLGYEDDNFRLHIPMKTNDEVEFVLDGEELKMAVGECWYTNVNYVHSVVNRGEEERVHLVIDGERNNWSDELFFSIAPKESFLLKEDSIESMQKMIQGLQEMGTSVSLKLVQDLEGKIEERIGK